VSPGNIKVPQILRDYRGLANTYYMLLTERRIPLLDETFSAEEAVQYDEHAKLFMLPVYRHFARQILARKRNSGRVLDIGAGSALLSIELAKTPGWNSPMVALDLSAQMLQLAQNNLGQAGLGNKITLVQASASLLPFAPGSFDIVVSNASLHSWKEPLAVLSQVKRVTRSDGLCLIRDNLRLPYLLAPLISVVSRSKGMTEKQRRLWWRAIKAGYTLPEARSLFVRAGLKEARVGVNPTFLDLIIVWSPK
jgi:ubiquinone/menaquinone biosynthesis C-methylase UbiE